MTVTGWRKASHSNGTNCAEAASCRHGVAVRDTADRGGPVLVFGAEAWRAFLSSLRSEP